MARRSSGLVAVVAMALVTACGDGNPPSAPQEGPSLAQTAPPFACTFTGNPSLSNAANSYFTTTTDRKAASDLIALMQAKFTDSSYTGAQEPGFDLLGLTGRVSRSLSAGDPVVGGTLVQQAIQCMFDVGAANTDSTQDFFGWPGDNQFDFASSLASTTGGALFVRGSLTAYDPDSAPVVANDAGRGTGAAGNVAGMAPPVGYGWRVRPGVAQGILTNRVMIYGEPVAEGYDWKLIPRGTAFTPSATVGLCPAATTTPDNDSSMVVQEDVGVLGFADATAICNTNPATLAAGDTRASSFAMVGRLAQYAARFFAPEPLHATALATSTIGGSASGARKDIFLLKTVGRVQLVMTSSRNYGLPKGIKANAPNSLGDLKIVVTTLDGLSVGGVTVSLNAVNNNGPTFIGEFINGTCVVDDAKTTVATVGTGGTTAETAVTWKDGCVTKTGIVQIIATATADGRKGGLGTAQSPRFNVKP